MFAKHSFDVKYHTIEIMTAALISPSPTPTSAPPRPTALSEEVYRRRRLTVAAVAIGLLLGLASFGRRADATPTAEPRAAEAVVVVVQPGDTLWSIAGSLAPGTDPRPLVAELVEIAGDGTLQPGQMLTIPRDPVD